MKNELMRLLSPPNVNKTCFGGGDFHPLGSCVNLTNPDIHARGRLSAHFCTGSRLFLFRSSYHPSLNMELSLIICGDKTSIKIINQKTERMKEQVTMAYEAPNVDVIEVEVECGFALSDFGDGGTL